MDQTPVNDTTLANLLETCASPSTQTNDLGATLPTNFLRNEGDRVFGVHMSVYIYIHIRLYLYMVFLYVFRYTYTCTYAHTHTHNPPTYPPTYIPTDILTYLQYISLHYLTSGYYICIVYLHV